MGLFSRRDKEGYDKKGYDEDGYDREGYDKDGFNKKGYDKKGYDREGYDRKGFDANEIHKITKTKFGTEGYDKKRFDKDGFNKKGYDKNGYDKDGFNKKGYDKNGYDKDGFNKKGYDKKRFDKDGYDKKGYDKDGYNRKGFGTDEINKITKTKFDETGFNKYGFDKKGYDVGGFNLDGFNVDGINKFTKTKFDDTGFDRDGYDKNGHDRRGLKQFNITSKFSKIISSFNSDFDAFVTLVYHEPSTVLSKSFFSHDKKTGIYSKSFESFSNNNMVHFHIEKAGKQYGTIWNKPKDTGKLQGDNFESGYTLIVNFNKNDSELKSILIKKLGRMNFGSLPSEYTLDCHLNEEYPNDERAKELLQIIVGLFSTAATVDFSSNDPTRT